VGPLAGVAPGDSIGRAPAGIAANAWGG